MGRTWPIGCEEEEEEGAGLTGGKYVPLVLEELLDDAPVTWARSYGGPLLPPMMLREPITDLPLDMPVDTARDHETEVRAHTMRL